MSDLDKLADFSHGVFPKNFIIPTKVLKDWYKMNPDIFLIAKDSVKNNRIIGYFISVPLLNNAYSKVFHDDFHEKDTSLRISKNTTKRANSSFIFVPSPLTLHTFLPTVIYKKMLRSYMDLLWEWMIKDIFISELSANTISEGGEKLCSFLGMRYLKTFSDGTKVFLPTPFRKGSVFYPRKAMKFITPMGYPILN